MTQYVLFSGASSGIGKAASEALATQGMTVFAGALNEAEAEAMRATGIKGIVPVVLDVTSIASIDAAIATVSELIGKDGCLNVLVNCAGVDYNAPLQTLEVREITQMVNVNYLGGVLLTRAAMSLMKKDQSRVVCIGSAMGLMPTPIVTIYSSTKTAIEGFCDALRVELIPLGIKVVLVEPGVIKTPLTGAAPKMLETMLSRMSGEMRAHYEKGMRTIVAGSTNPKTTSSTEVSSKVIVEAVTSANPARRYQIGLDGKAAKIVNLLPHAVQDWIHKKVMGF